MNNLAYHFNKPDTTVAHSSSYLSPFQRSSVSIESKITPNHSLSSIVSFIALMTLWNYLVYLFFLLFLNRNISSNESPMNQEICLSRLAGYPQNLSSTVTDTVYLFQYILKKYVKSITRLQTWNFQIN